MAVESHAFRCESIHRGAGGSLVTISAQSIRSQRIDQQKHDVQIFSFGEL